jgi:hypothetical protein
MSSSDNSHDSAEVPRQGEKPAEANAPWIIGMFLAAETMLAFAASRFGDFTIHPHALRFVAIISGAAVCFLVAVLTFEKHAGRRAVLFFWGGAVAIRLAMLSCWPGDDMWRYIWEGRIQVQGFNPYRHAPLSTALQPSRDEIWPRINHPEFPAIYPPGAELIFAGLAAVSPSILAFKLLFVAADIATVWLIVRLCIESPAGGRGRNPYATAAWYAWNPAVAYAFAGAGHYDSLMLCALTAGYWVLARSRPRAAPAAVTTIAATASDESVPVVHSPDTSTARAWARSFAGALLLGIAGALKIVPLFLLPAWLAATRWWSAVLLGAVVIPATLCFLYGGIATVFTPLIAFAEVTRFQDLVWWAIETLTVPNPFQRNWPFAAILMVACIIIAVRYRRDWRRSALWILGLALVLSPVLHPWYVTWILPLAVWQRVRAWTILSLSALFSLLLWEATPWWNQWEPNALTRALVIVPAAAAWIIEQHLQRKKEAAPA